jgi:hypothetical protein
VRGQFPNPAFLPEAQPRLSIIGSIITIVIAIMHG